MAWTDKITTTLFGRRLGLQTMTTSQTGSGQTGRTAEFIVGPDAIRWGTSTSQTTATYMPAHGVSVLSSATTPSTAAVIRLDPPIPGVDKTVVILSTAAGVASTIDWIITASTGGAETFVSTWSSSFTVLRTTNPVVIRLRGLSTGMWGLANSSASFSQAATTTT